MDLKISPVSSPQIKISMPASIKKQAGVSISLIVFLLILIGAAYWYLVKPEQNKLSLAQTQLAQLLKTQSSVKTDVDTLQTLIAKLKSNADDVGRLDEALPLQDSNFRLQTLITTLAQDSGVTLASVSVGGGQEGIAAGNKDLLAHPYSVARKLQTDTIQLSVTGTYDQLKSFLEKLEDNSRIMNTQNLTIGESAGKTLSMSLSLAAYAYVPQ